MSSLNKDPVIHICSERMNVSLKMMCFIANTSMIHWEKNETFPQAQSSVSVKQWATQSPESRKCSRELLKEVEIGFKCSNFFYIFIALAMRMNRFPESRVASRKSSRLLGFCLWAKM